MGARVRLRGGLPAFGRDRDGCEEISSSLSLRGQPRENQVKIYMNSSQKHIVPYHRPAIGKEEMDEVQDTLLSGWLTTGPKTKRFEEAFARFIGKKHAVALNSATAALHLALEAIGLQRGDLVVVPTMTFAATAEVVRYFDATPLLVDCREDDFNIDCCHARDLVVNAIARGQKVRAIIPVHYGGQVADMESIRSLASEFNLAIIEDAAHCCPAYFRDNGNQEWKAVGCDAAISCFSFYANKCITTGEGGMACTDSDKLAERMRTMSLHGISKDAWKRFTSEGSWYYEIVAPGFKYNLTDIAASIGFQQLRKANVFLEERKRIAREYFDRLKTITALILPAEKADRIHSWHLYVVRLRLDMLNIDRAMVIDLLKKMGITTSVHWMPLHMHPYYRDTYNYKPRDLPVSSRLYSEIISLPIFPGMTEKDINAVCDSLKTIISEHS